MKQVWITKVGEPEVLQVRETQDPEPSDNEVRIRVKASGVNFADVMARVGLYPDAPGLPFVVGYEVAGDIDAVGKGVRRFKEGDRVFALTRFGGYTDVACANASQVFPIPTEFCYEKAASLPVNYLTAYQMLVKMAGVKRGEWVLIHGLGGGVGIAALDIANHLGAQVIGTASKWKHDTLRKRGAKHLVDYRNEDFEERVRAMTGGRGIHVALDPVGGSSWKKSYRCLDSTGRLVMYGFSGAATQKGRSTLGALQNLVSTPWLDFNPINLMNDNKGVLGVNLGHMWHRPEWIREWMDQIVAWAKEGKVDPHAGERFPLENAAAAHHCLQDRKNIGKVLLLPRR